MMENKSKIGIKIDKKEWNIPVLQVIPFKNTKGGVATSVEETLGGTVGTLS